MAVFHIVVSIRINIFIIIVVIIFLNLQRKVHTHQLTTSFQNNYQTGRHCNADKTCKTLTF